MSCDLHPRPCLAIGVSLSFLLLLAGCAAESPDFENSPVAARVNGQPIYQGEVESAVEQFVATVDSFEPAMAAAAGRSPDGEVDRNAVCKRTMGQLVVDRLKMQEAVVRKVSVPRAAVAEALATADALRVSAPDVAEAERRSRQQSGLSRRAYERAREEEYTASLLRSAVDRAVLEELGTEDVAALEGYWQERWRSSELDFALDCDLRYPPPAGAPPAAAP